MAVTDIMPIEEWNPYTGTLTSEQASADARASADRAAQDASVANWLAAENKKAEQNKVAVDKQIQTNLDKANLEASASFRNQMSQWQPGTMTASADALLQGGYQNAIGTNNQSAQDANEATAYQAAMTANSLAQLAGQQQFQNLATSQQRANENALQQWQAGLTRDNDMWGRMNTTTQQSREQLNTNRNADLAARQWEDQNAIDWANLEVERINVDAQIEAIKKAEEEAAAARAAAARSSSGSGSSGSKSTGSSGKTQTWDLYRYNPKTGMLVHSGTMTGDEEKAAAYGQNWGAVVPKGTPRKDVQAAVGATSYAGSFQQARSGDARRLYYGTK